MQQRLLVSVFLATALAFAAAGCDSSPTGPSDLEGGATLRGQVRQGNGSASTQLAGDSFYRAQTAAAAEVTSVMVLDSSLQEIATVPVVNGAFTLRGLPDSFYLRFLDENGNPIGDDMLFGGVKPNQEIDIIVALRNGEVVLVREKRTGIDHEGAGGIEIEGTATNVVIDNAPADLVTGSLDVNGYHIVTRRGETSIRKGNRSLTLEDIEGKQVHVRGVFEGTDVFAQEIKLQDEGEEDDIEGGEKVTLCHIPPGNPGNAKTITVGASAVDAHLAHGDTLGPCS
ncbi:MAG: hypothetical protein ACRD1X_15250 [Vicinamibacteria bacterium]